MRLTSSPFPHATAVLLLTKRSTTASAAALHTKQASTIATNTRMYTHIQALRSSQARHCGLWAPTLHMGLWWAVFKWTMGPSAACVQASSC
jgi:hypothetical protein